MAMAFVCFVLFFFTGNIVFLIAVFAIIAKHKNIKEVKNIEDIKKILFSNTISSIKIQNKSSIEQMHIDHANHVGGTHEDHMIITTKHNSNQSFLRNNEKDIVKDKKLSEAERNVLYGK